MNHQTNFFIALDVHGVIRTKKSKLRQYYKSKKKGKKHKAIMVVARAVSDLVYKKLSQK